jgi:hypothetical protein
MSTTETKPPLPIYGQLRIAGLVALGIVVVVFGWNNRAVAPVWIGAELRIPIGLIVVFAAGAGFGVGRLLGWRATRRVLGARKVVKESSPPPAGRDRDPLP